MSTKNVFFIYNNDPMGGWMYILGELRWVSLNAISIPKKHAEFGICSFFSSVGWKTL